MNDNNVPTWGIALCLFIGGMFAFFFLIHAVIVVELLRRGMYVDVIGLHPLFLISIGVGVVGGIAIAYGVLSLPPASSGMAMGLAAIGGLLAAVGLGLWLADPGFGWIGPAPDIMHPRASLFGHGFTVVLGILALSYAVRSMPSRQQVSRGE